MEKILTVRDSNPCRSLKRLFFTGATGTLVVVEVDPRKDSTKNKIWKGVDLFFVEWTYDPFLEEIFLLPEWYNH